MLMGSCGGTRTLAEYLGYWLDNHAELRCQPKTLARYRQFAEHLIRDLRPAAIQKAVNWLQLRGVVTANAHPRGRPPRSRRPLCSRRCGRLKSPSGF